jgi:hypothetical protein
MVDRSQARSAWESMQRGPRPGGTVEVVFSLKGFFDAHAESAITLLPAKVVQLSEVW